MLLNEFRHTSVMLLYYNMQMFETTCCIQIANLGHYEIPSIEKNIMNNFVTKKKNHKHLLMIRGTRRIFFNDGKSFR